MLTSASQRLHSLDNLRAIMMWLGIVLHVASNHMEGPGSPLPWHDDKTTPVANLLLAFIHSFRMPVFFVLAGFFVAMLVSRRGYGGMLKHRWQRLGLPFLVFWPLIFAATIPLVMLYIHQMVRGSLGLDLSIMPKELPGGEPLNTMHLWFLYLLFWFCVATAAFGSLASKVLPSAPREAFWRAVQTLGLRWWGFLLLAAPLGWIGSEYAFGVLLVSGSFLPPPVEWIHHGLFFVFGLALYRARELMLAHYTRHWARYAGAGLVFFFAMGALFEFTQKNPTAIAHAALLGAFLYNCVTWLWSFALIGAFLRFLPRQNRVLQYLADSSYWSYLIHMLGTIGFGALLYGQPLGALSKMAINMGATTVVCLLSYQFLVRHTAIGTLLNGQRHGVTAVKSGATAAAPAA